MLIEKSDINKYNEEILKDHKRRVAFVAGEVDNINDIIDELE